MTLFRQISLTFAIFFVFALGAVLVTNYLDAQKLIEDEIYRETRNNTAILAMTMSQTNGDVSKMKIMADAVFDMGLYSRIVLKDAKGIILFD